MPIASLAPGFNLGRIPGARAPPTYNQPSDKIAQLVKLRVRLIEPS